MTRIIPLPVPPPPALMQNLASVIAAALDHAWSPQSLAAILAQDTSFGSYVDDGNMVVGFALARRAGDDVEILAIAVLPECRRRGLGRALLQNLLAQSGGARILLEVAADNPVAIGLYHKAGFREYDLRPQYYLRPGRPRVDAVLMER